MARTARVVFLVCLLGSCDGGTGPDTGGPTDLPGLWNASIFGIQGTGAPGRGVTCSVDWVMAIEPYVGRQPPAFLTFIPISAKFVCSDGVSAPWYLRGGALEIRQSGDSVTFTVDGNEPLVVAVSRGSRLVGRTAEFYYPGASFSAERRAGSDPNLEPYELEIGLRNLEVGDTLRSDVQLRNGYNHSIADPTLRWSSSAPDVASVSAAGVVRALAPGHTTIRAAIGSLEATADLEVLTPAASLEITQVPDSLIEPAGHYLVGVARNAGGLFHWMSSDPTVATVSELGSDALVTARSRGTVTITARSSHLTASATLTILPAVADIVITGTDGRVPIAGSVQLVASTRDRHWNPLTGRPVTWDAESGGAVAVDPDGLVTTFRERMRLAVRGPEAQNPEEVGPPTVGFAGGGEAAGVPRTGSDLGELVATGHGLQGRPDLLLGTSAAPASAVGW